MRAVVSLAGEGAASRPLTPAPGHRALVENLFKRPTAAQGHLHPLCMPPNSCAGANKVTSARSNVPFCTPVDIPNPIGIWCSDLAPRHSKSIDDYLILLGWLVVCIAQLGLASAPLFLNKPSCDGADGLGQSAYTTHIRDGFLGADVLGVLYGAQNPALRRHHFVIAAL